MKNLARALTAVSFALNLPAIVIWSIVVLRSTNYPVGDSMAVWLSANFSVPGILLLWLFMPSTALIFGLGSYAIAGKKVFNLGVVAISTALLISLAIGGMLASQN